MIHNNCKNTNQHNWDRWETGAFRSDGIPVQTFPDGSWECLTKDMDKIRFYRRVCQTMGCDAVEFAESLVASGKHEVVDVGGSQALYITDENIEKALTYECHQCGAAVGAPCDVEKAGFAHYTRIPAIA